MRKAQYLIAFLTIAEGGSNQCKYGIRSSGRDMKKEIGSDQSIPVFIRGEDKWKSKQGWGSRFNLTQIDKKKDF